MDPAEPVDPEPVDRPAARLDRPGPNGNGDGRWPGPNAGGVGAASAAADDVVASPPEHTCEYTCEYTCPNCSVTFTVPAEPAGPVLECPACHTQFFIPAGDDWRDGRDEADELEERDPAAEFNRNHIDQVKELRRGLYRTRNYVMVGVFALAAIAFDLVFLALRHLVFGTWGLRAIGYVFAAVGCVIGAVMLRRRTREIDRELDETALPEPDTEPDLSTLSDGSQFVETLGQHLERMRRRRDPPAAAPSADGPGVEPPSE